MNDSTKYPLTQENYRFEWTPAQSAADSLNHLHPILNNTKWDELRLAMCSLAVKTRFRVKTLGNANVSGWDGEWFYHFRGGGYKDIEWAEVSFAEEDRTSVIKALAVNSIPYELSENGLRVFGYIDDTGRLTVAKPRP